MTTALENYHARMQRVLDHIDRHLDDDLDLDALSCVAAFSKFHFHRQFTAVFALSVHRYVQLARMKRASYRLAYGDAQSVTDIAIDAGYDAPDAFARAFRQRFGQSPSSFRKSPDWEPWLAAFGPLDNARSKLMQKTFTNDDVTIRDVPPTPVAIMEHRGDPATLGATIQRFIAWRRAAGRKPVAIKVERGGLQIVGVANDAQHRAASARDLAGFDLLAVRLDRLVGPDTKVHAIIGRRRRTPLGTPDIEGRTCPGVQASGLAPRDEPLDGGAERRRVAPMLHDRHRCGVHIANRHVVGGKSLLHELAPRVVERPEGRKPRLPVGRLPERRRRLPEPLPKGASEGVRRIVTGIHRYVRDALGVHVGQSVRSAFHTGKLDIAMH